MNHVTFFNEKTPLSRIDQNYFSLEPSQCIKLKRIGWIASAILGAVIATIEIYDGTKTIIAKPLKTGEVIFSSIEIVTGFFFWMIICGCGGASLGGYQMKKESYQLSEAYQGTLADDLTNFLDFDKFEVKTWEPFLSNFLIQFEPVLLDKYFLLKKIKNRIDYLCKQLRKGCCFGYSMALLAKMKKNAQLSSKELKDSIKIENVVYYALVNKILWKLNDSFFRIYTLLYHFYLKEEHSVTFKQFLNEAEFIDLQDNDQTTCNLINVININRMNNKYHFRSVFQSIDEVKNAVSFRRLFFNYCNLFSDGILFHNSDKLNNYETTLNQKEQLVKLFQKAETDIFKQSSGNLVELTLAGHISLNFNKTDEKRVGHAFFFQISDHYFRYMDSGSPFNHFFEYQTLENMIEGLVDHLKTCYGKNKHITLEIILLGIPRTSDQTADPLNLVINSIFQVK